MASARPAFYLLPGLGADERVFAFLQLKAVGKVVQWLPPASATETIQAYAARLAAAVPQDEACWLVGVSFGGVLAQEVHRLRPLTRVVLISSVAGPAELPQLAWVARATRLHHLLPHQLLKHTSWAARWFFGVPQEHYPLFKRIIAETDATFARWAIHQLLHWPGTGQQPLLRLHGAADQLLPPPSTGVQHRLPGAGHFMIVTHAAEISQILNQLHATYRTAA